MGVLVAAIVMLMTGWLHASLFWRVWRSSLTRAGRRKRLYPTAICFMVAVAVLGRYLVQVVGKGALTYWELVAAGVVGGVALAEFSVRVSQLGSQ